VDGAQISPGLAWLLGVAVSTGPAYIAARRSRGAAQEQGELTREALSEVVGHINGRIDELRIDISEVRDWQAAHTTEHAIADIRRTGPSGRLEYRNRPQE
jgi:hypothetical protein